MTHCGYNDDTSRGAKTFLWFSYMNTAFFAMLLYFSCSLSDESEAISSLENYEYIYTRRSKSILTYFSIYDNISNIV